MRFFFSNFLRAKVEYCCAKQGTKVPGNTVTGYFNRYTLCLNSSTACDTLLFEALHIYISYRLSGCPREEEEEKLLRQVKHCTSPAACDSIICKYIYTDTASDIGDVNRIFHRKFFVI